LRAVMSENWICSIPAHDHEYRDMRKKRSACSTAKLKPNKIHAHHKHVARTHLGI
jgi:hypothetical protein